MMMSAKKEILLQLQQMHKEEHSTFEFEIEFFLEKLSIIVFIRYFSFIYVEICSQKGGGVCQGLTSLLRGGVQCLTNADKGGRGGQKGPKIC